MNKLILVLLVFSVLNTNAQVVLSPADKILLEEEVKLICKQDRAYFESIIKDRAQETGNSGNILCALKSKPFANISMTAGFKYSCYYNYGNKTASYSVEIGGIGEKFEVFQLELQMLLNKLTREGIFKYYENRNNNYCMVTTDGNKVDMERGTFSFERFKAYAAFNIYSRSFSTNGSANITSTPGNNGSAKPVSAVPAIVKKPESAVPVVAKMATGMEDKYKTNMEAGDKAMAESDYLAAITKFETATTINAKDGKSQLMLGLAHLSYADKVYTVTNPELYRQHYGLGRNAIMRANTLSPENPVIMYYNWTYNASTSNTSENIAFLDKIIELTKFKFREPVYRRCKYKLYAAYNLRLKMDKQYLTTEMVNSYKSLSESGLREFQYILKNYTAEPMDIYQYAGMIYLIEYKIDSAVYCLQKVKDNADKIKWFNTDLNDVYETAEIIQIRLKHTSLENIIKSDNLLRSNSFTAAIEADNYNAMAYVKRAESNQHKDLVLGVEHLKENIALHKLIAADYVAARNIYPAILQGKINDVIAFMNDRIYKEEHFNDLSTSRISGSSASSDNYRAPTDLYNSANAASTRYEMLLKCSYCRGTGEVYDRNGGFSTNTYYLLGGSGLTYQSKTYNSSYTKCDKCKGTGKIRN